MLHKDTKFELNVESELCNTKKLPVSEYDAV